MPKMREPSRSKSDLTLKRSSRRHPRPSPSSNSMSPPSQPRSLANDEENSTFEGIVEEEEEGEEEEGDEVSGASTANQNLTPDDLKGLVYKTVRLALSMDRKKQPLRKEDVRKNILQDTPKLFRPVLAGAQEELQRVFGMELVELPLHKKGSLTLAEKRAAVKKTKSASTTSHAYILRNIIPSEFRQSDIISYGPRESSHLSLIYILLSLILVNSKSITHEQLFYYLEKLGFHEKEPLESFNWNTIEEMISLYQSQGYLDRLKIKGVRDDAPDKEKYLYMWGPRAEVEVTDEKMMDFICQVHPYGDIAFKDWPSGPEELRKALKRSCESS